MTCTRYPHRPAICPSSRCAEAVICLTNLEAAYVEADINAAFLARHFVCDSCGTLHPVVERVVVFEGLGLTDHDDGTWRYCRGCKP